MFFFCLFLSLKNIVWKITVIRLRLFSWLYSLFSASGSMYVCSSKMVHWPEAWELWVPSPIADSMNLRYADSIKTCYRLGHKLLISAWLSQGLLKFSLSFKNKFFVSLWTWSCQAYTLSPCVKLWPELFAKSSGHPLSLPNTPDWGLCPHCNKENR